MIDQNNIKHEIIIVGGGVLGISLAYHLSKQGKKSLILEKEELPCTHASAKNAGMIRQLYRNEQLTDWTERSINTWDDHIKSTYFKQTGSLVVGRTAPKHHAHLFENTTVSLEGKEVSAVYTRTDGLLESESYVQYLKKQTLNTGVKIQTSTKIVNISKLSNGNWQLVSDKNKIYECELLINAAGAWLNSFLDLNMQAPAKSYVRHLFLSHGWDKIQTNTLPEHGFYWDELHSWYRRNWGETDALVSACDENSCDPDSYSTNPEISFIMADKILSEFPEQGKEITLGKAWYCFRTYTTDQLPIIGFDEYHSNFYWLCAFGGFGMSTSFAATEDAALEIKGSKKRYQNFSKNRL